jgi:hypothetical protein
MQPIQVTVTGTAASTAFLMDYMQNPFQVSVACVLGTAAGTFSVQHTFDYTTVFSPTWNGSTGVTWFNNSGITNATATISGNYAFPVAAIRLNVTNAVATTTVAMTITQASNAP